MKKIIVTLVSILLVAGLYVINENSKTVEVVEYSTHDIELLNFSSVNMKDGNKFNDDKSILLFFNENGKHYTFKVEVRKSLLGSAGKVISKELIE